MISVFDIFLKMLKFVAPFNTKIVIMINVTRFVILGVIRGKEGTRGRYGNGTPRCLNFSTVDKQVVTGFRHAV